MTTEFEVGDLVKDRYDNIVWRVGHIDDHGFVFVHNAELSESFWHENLRPVYTFFDLGRKWEDAKSRGNPTISIHDQIWGSDDFSLIWDKYCARNTPLPRHFANLYDYTTER